MTFTLLCSFRRCPYAMRARMALDVSGMVHKTVEVRLSDKPAAMLAASPKGTVPVLLRADGRVLDESLDIMRHALSVSDPEHWLGRYSQDLVTQNDTVFKSHLDRYKYATRYDTDPKTERQKGLNILRALECQLGQQPYLHGDAMGLTDAAILPFVRQFAGVDPDWFGRQNIPAVQRWLAGFVASLRFRRIMDRRQGDTATENPRAESAGSDGQN